MSSSLESVIVDNAHVVKQRIIEACAASNRDSSMVTLVAVSKTKPASDIQQLYDAGYRHFGENYFQEISEKARLLPSDICWHFIGHLQSSKASKLIREVPNLFCIHTIDSEKLATKLETACSASGRSNKLKVLIQIDTSNEDTKSGVTIDEMVGLAAYIQTNCPSLALSGVMTIGAPGDMSCFDQLVVARQRLAESLGIEDATKLELSMGMSGDYVEAVSRGSTYVRVGSTIFGERIYPAKSNST